MIRQCLILIIASSSLIACGQVGNSAAGQNNSASVSGGSNNQANLMAVEFLSSAQQAASEASSNAASGLAAGLSAKDVSLQIYLVQKLINLISAEDLSGASQTLLSQRAQLLADLQSTLASLKAASAAVTAVSNPSLPALPCVQVIAGFLGINAGISSTSCSVSSVAASIQPCSGAIASFLGISASQCANVGVLPSCTASQVAEYQAAVNAVNGLAQLAGYQFSPQVPYCQ